ncbi:Gfo/Idh/MocA family oxidoreductase [Oleiharenicola lentus]|uniref:Gfo/Idh/MocA family oxidoreductase n=1 Tax=Oleiharenicola lentus TaxID=2508720 RepID=A0A4Q1C504_9BACT|nr:Gfo/Idh/MocA family oxidoreductase [Oleiharenicola lentus]RXK53490.1 Gfo/Idh/MocA family oxidoreductase [Oleiharenicola lentus]
MSLRFCMVGCGWFANHQYGPAIKQLIARHPAWEFSACCDVIEQKSHSFAVEFGAKRSYPDLLAMCRAERPNVILMAVPSGVMYEGALAVLREGLPLLLEKPPGLTVDQWSSLEAVATQSRVPNLVAFNRRHMPAVSRARAVLEEKFERTHISRISYTMLRSGRLNEDFSTTAIHALDTLLFLGGSPYKEAQFRFGPVERGQPVRITMDAVSHGGIRSHLDILPDAGRSVEMISVDAPGQTLEIRLAATPEAELQGEVDYWRKGVRHAVYSDAASPVHLRSGVYNEIESFCLAIEHAATCPSPTLSECGQQVALMEAIRAQRTKRLVWDMQERKLVTVH